MTEPRALVVAISGRPNAGKSTLFNRLLKRRQAIVHDTPGVTRDENRAKLEREGRTIELVDTGGIEEEPLQGSLGRRVHDRTYAVLEQADVISVHVHLSAETKGLVGVRQFESMKPGAIFINTSRGGVCDEAALLRALESGQLGGAGLDVLDGEPDTAEHSLVRYARSHDNLLITPHCGGFSPDAVRRVCAHAADKALIHLRQFV